MDGFVNLIKPAGPSSFHIVKRVKGILDVKKVGHTGTLDPGAAGVLPLCIGSATKLAGLLTGSDKYYRAEITFGIQTDTQDSSGRVLASTDAEITPAEVENLLAGFRGKIAQVPPMYSALKANGKRLYDLARKGIEVERDHRYVEIKRLALVDFFPPNRAIIDVECSKGTYIRTLCHDIGAVSGFGAVMSYLVRVSAGGFHVKDGITIEEIEALAREGNGDKCLLPLDYPLGHMASVQIKDTALKFVLNGNRLFRHNLVVFPENIADRQYIRIYHKHKMIALGISAVDGEKRCIDIRNVFGHCM
jgi:tRNA pseudouridine55 synthase